MLLIYLSSLGVEVGEGVISADAKGTADDRATAGRGRQLALAGGGGGGRRGTQGRAPAVPRGRRVAHGGRRGGRRRVGGAHRQFPCGGNFVRCQSVQDLKRFAVFVN